MNNITRRSNIMPTNNITCANHIRPDNRKRKLVVDLASVLRKSGIDIMNLSYGVIDDEECFTVRMRSGKVYTVNVSMYSPIAAATALLSYMQDK